MAAATTENEPVHDRALAQELIGDLAELLNDTRPVLALDGGLLAALTAGLGVEAGLSRHPGGSGAAVLFTGALFACLAACWLMAIIRLVLAGRPVLGMVNDHRWQAGAPLDPRARWLHLPPIKASREEWIWVRAHLLVGAARIRAERVQRSLCWTLAATALFLAWTAVLFLSG